MPSKTELTIVSILGFFTGIMKYLIESQLRVMEFTWFGLAQYAVGLSLIFVTIMFLVDFLYPNRERLG